MDHRHLPLEHHRQGLEAIELLRKLDRNEDVAGWAESIVPDVLRPSFARRYRELIGVPPERRGELRAALERIRDGGGGDVADVLAAIQANESS